MSNTGEFMNYLELAVSAVSLIVTPVYRHCNIFLQKLLENQMASFRIVLKFLWTKKTGKVKKLGKKSVGEPSDALAEIAAGEQMDEN